MTSWEKAMEHLDSTEPLLDDVLATTTTQRQFLESLDRELDELREIWYDH